MIPIIVILVIAGIGIEVYAYREAQKCESLIKRLKDINPEAVIQAIYAHFYRIENDSTYHAINVLSERLGIVIYVDGHLKEPEELKRLVLEALTREELNYLVKRFSRELGN